MQSLKTQFSLKIANSSPQKFLAKFIYRIDISIKWKAWNLITTEILLTDPMAGYKMINQENQKLSKNQTNSLSR